MSVQNSTVAVLMTCHNRRETTLCCLESLYQAQIPEDTATTVYLVDDGSTDGTGDAVRERYPDVNVLNGDGNLYWCGGTRMAWSEAMKQDYEYYLWLNDDTHICENALRNMIDTAEVIRKIDGREGIVVGSTSNPETGKQTYGGVRRIGNMLGFELIEPQEKPLRCDTMNGNCVLIPRAVARVTGNLSDAFTHAIGDMDYGLRAGKDGFSCWIAPGYVGKCRRNQPPEWSNPAIGLMQRLGFMRTEKGISPREWYVFCRRHTGYLWFFYFVKPFLKVTSPSAYRKLKDIKKRFGNENG